MYSTKAQMTMAKMGYKEGTGLGADGQGIAAPIVESEKFRRRGLGFDAKEAVRSSGEPRSPRLPLTSSLASLPLPRPFFLHAHTHTLCLTHSLCLPVSCALTRAAGMPVGKQADEGPASTREPAAEGVEVDDGEQPVVQAVIASTPANDGDGPPADNV